MRVRITKVLTGSIDGIQLSKLSMGQVYDVHTTLGCYLLSEEMAEPAPNAVTTAILPVEKQMFRDEPRRSVILPRSFATDRPAPKKPEPES
jgi:hypothetical protein